MSGWSNLVVVDARARQYVRVRFSHKMKRRYVDQRVNVLPEDLLLTPSEVEQYRMETLQFDQAPTAA
jgi:hypothetical protein